MRPAMGIIGIDPGSEKTAWVVLQRSTVYQTTPHRVCGHGIVPNGEFLMLCRGGFGFPPPCEAAFETIASYGMAVGQEIFDTCIWTGRFIEAWDRNNQSELFPSEEPRYRFSRVYRKEVKLHLCGNLRAKDANVNQAVQDRYGGSKCKGLKACPGPLYGFGTHLWAALAVAITRADQISDEFLRSLTAEGQGNGREGKIAA